MSFESGFFEYLNIAGAERIHSQMIAWLLSKDSPLDVGQKNKFLFNFIGEQITPDPELDVVTEYLNVDIVIKANNKDLYLIENKLKSSEHSGQLKEYSKKIEAAIKGKKGFAAGCNKPSGKYFLTLIGESASQDDWEAISYEKLLDTVKKIEPLPEGHEQIISAYRKTLENLISAQNAFLADHMNFENVFTDGKTKKAEKQCLSSENVNPAQKYIADCQLETIFQKLFFRRVADELNWSLENGLVNETRGTALCQVDFAEKDVPRLQIEGREYKFGFQVQGDSVKLNFHIADAKKYAKSKKEWISNVVGVFKNFEKEKKEAGEKLRLNKPTSLAYVSLSYKLCPYAYSFDELCNEYKKAHEKVREWAKELAPIIQQVYS